MKTKLCKKVGCQRTAVEGKDYCMKHIALQDVKRPIFTQRKSSSQWHDLYNTSEWRTKSKAFLRKYPACCICGKPSKITDHITPHCGNLDLFWDEDNWQPLCWSCHSRKTLKENNYFHKPNHNTNNEPKG